MNMEYLTEDARDVVSEFLTNGQVKNDETPISNASKFMEDLDYTMHVTGKRMYYIVRVKTPQGITKSFITPDLNIGFVYGIHLHRNYDTVGILDLPDDMKRFIVDHQFKKESDLVEVIGWDPSVYNVDSDHETKVKFLGNFFNNMDAFEL